MNTTKDWVALVSRLHMELYQVRCELLRELEEREFYRRRYYQAQAICLRQQELLARMNEQNQGLVDAVNHVNKQTEDLINAVDQQRAAMMAKQPEQPVVVVEGEQ